nr:cytochrome c oxidase subunit 3 family protein [uncultured Holophaga sp.]
MTEHRDDFGARLGMWLFLVTEILLFGGLFISYAYMRARYPVEFHHAGAELNAVLGVTNTFVLLTSSLLVALGILAVQRGQDRLAKLLVSSTVLLGLVFLVIKAFEWRAKFHHGLYPDSPLIATLPQGERIFFGLYFTMTGLHGLHVVIGMVVLSVMVFMMSRGRVRPDSYAALENAGLYWHLVDIIWIFLLPLFYLAA